jgi:hypothetical protein
MREGKSLSGVPEMRPNNINPTFGLLHELFLKTEVLEKP